MLGTRPSRRRKAKNEAMKKSKKNQSKPSANSERSTPLYLGKLLSQDIGQNRDSEERVSWEDDLKEKEKRERTTTESKPVKK
jgi:hypothetical protein